MLAAVAAQLRYCAELLNARCAEPVRTDLFSAVGKFAQTARTMAFDTFAHDDARRVSASRCPAPKRRAIGNLRADVLAVMANQEILVW